jgi:hypothetical protein
MQPLFPDDRSPIPPAIPRWVRLVATLDHSGAVVAAQLDAMSVSGELLLGRGFWPTSGRPGDAEPLRTMLRFAQELVMD